MYIVHCLSLSTTSVDLTKTQKTHTHTEPLPPSPPLPPPSLPSSPQSLHLLLSRDPRFGPPPFGPPPLRAPLRAATLRALHFGLPPTFFCPPPFGPVSVLCVFWGVSCFFWCFLVVRWLVRGVLCDSLVAEVDHTKIGNWPTIGSCRIGQMSKLTEHWQLNCHRA